MQFHLSLLNIERMSEASLNLQHHNKFKSRLDGLSVFSQHRQDEVLEKVVFKNKETGIFLDIGANDGITYSNTFFFEKYREWNGLCVEPLLSAFDKLKMNRKCLVENCAVGNTNRIDILMEISGYSEMLFGLKKL